MKPAGYFLLAILAVMYLQETTAKAPKTRLWTLDDAGQCYERRQKDANVMSCEAGARLTEQVSNLEDTVAEMQTVINNQTDVIARIQVDLDEKGKTEKHESCIELSEGIHTLTVDGVQIQVYCDQTTDGGGWTVIQRRQDGSVDFYRTWEEYQQGFGDLNGEFWLGLDNIHRLTSAQNQTLRVDIEDFSNNTAYAEYSTFRVAGPSDNYRMTIGGYSGTVGDDETRGLSNNNNMMFSTKDRDHDIYAGSCAVDLKHGGWWYKQCSLAHLNGVYRGSGGTGQGIYWYSWKQHSPLKRVDMKLRPA